MHQRACHLDLKFGYGGIRALTNPRADGEVAP
jgi:hypothetical protein